jgi:CrcB protein
MPPLFLVMIGGAIGAGFRYHISSVALRHMGPGFPVGTWMINLLGGLAMGIVAGIVARGDIGAEQFRLFVGVGILGGFTTFSAFSLETFEMLTRGENLLALAYVVSSVAGSILLVMAGLWLSRGIA